MVVKDCSKFVLIIWLCLAFILMQSYTASLSSMLTLDQLQPTFDSVKELQRKGHFVGYQNGSFVKHLLLRLNFNDSKLIPYDNVRQYHKGSEYGGVTAIFDEIPYIKIFLGKYGSQFMMAGPTYRTDGFGFAFPKDSPLVSYISRAILEVREHGDTDKIEKKCFGDQKVTSYYLSPSISSDSSSLRAYSFGGLFIIAGIATLLALVISESYIWRKPVALAKEYSKKYLSSRSSNGTGTVIELVARSTIERDTGGHSPPEAEDSRKSERISWQISENILTSAEEDEAEKTEAR